MSNFTSISPHYPQTATLLKLAGECGIHWVGALAITRPESELEQLMHRFPSKHLRLAA